QVEATCWMAKERVRRRPEETPHGGVAVEVGEVDGQPAAGRVVGCERESEQAAFAGRAHLTREVEEAGRLYLSVDQHPDAPALFDDVLHGGIGRILDEPHWIGEAGRHE